MRQAVKVRRAKQILDILTVLCGIGVIYYILKEIRTWRITPPLVLAVAVCTAWVYRAARRHKSHR